MKTVRNVVHKHGQHKQCAFTQISRFTIECDMDPAPVHACPASSRSSLSSALMKRGAACTVPLLSCGDVGVPCDTPHHGVDKHSQTFCPQPYIMDLPLRKALANACCSPSEKPQASAKYVLGFPYLCRMCCRVACITCAGACENIRASKPTSFFKLRSLFRSGMFLDLHPGSPQHACYTAYLWLEFCKPSTLLAMHRQRHKLCRY